MVAAAAAETGLAVGNVAVVGAQLTLDRPIVQLLIISTFETIHYSLEYNGFVDV